MVTPTPATPLVQLNNVSKSFGPVQVLKDVSLEMYRGEVLCLAGENGAGKSTLIKILTGAISRDSGEYHIDGQDVGSPGPAQARALGVGVVYQELSLLPEVSVEENLLMGRLPNARGIVNKRELRARATMMLERVGLNNVDPSALISDLPVANRQMVEIAKVLGADARIVIFDEPTTALSEKDAHHLLQLIDRLKKEVGVAILYVTHRLEEIFEIGDRIMVLRDGQFVTTAPTNQFTHDSLIRSMVGRQIEALYPKREHKKFGKTLLSVQGLRLPGGPCRRDRRTRGIGRSRSHGDSACYFRGRSNGGRNRACRWQASASRISRASCESRTGATHRRPQRVRTASSPLNQGECDYCRFVCRYSTWRHLQKAGSLPGQ